MGLFDFFGEFFGFVGQIISFVWNSFTSLIGYVVSAVANFFSSISKAFLFALGLTSAFPDFVKAFLVTVIFFAGAALIIKVCPFVG